jgi:hypothetical protein
VKLQFLIPPVFYASSLIGVEARPDPEKNLLACWQDNQGRARCLAIDSQTWPAQGPDDKTLDFPERDFGTTA